VSEPAIIHESDAVLAVDKPHGWLTIPGRQGEADPRPVLVRELASRAGGKLWIVHRLDREVSGLVLFAKTAEAHRTLCGWFERHEVRKRYEAWTQGTPPTEGETVWEGWLIQGRRRTHETREPGKGKWARTIARFEGTGIHAGARLLRFALLPETGRTHQLRCQAASRGFPIAGDVLYGSTVAWLPDAIALRAVRLEFPRATDQVLVRLDLPRALVIPEPCVEEQSDAVRKRERHEEATRRRNGAK
jgi:tRNA pseudouridine32 synthase/23S rRNA pseudouridine746 synthase